MDTDLLAIQAARDAAARAAAAQREFSSATQEEVDRVVEAMALAAYREAERLGRLAFEETGHGNPEHKKLKNEHAAAQIALSLRGQRTAGLIRVLPESKLIELAEPMGLVAAIIPVTNPTSTPIFKALISVKGRNACVVAPHPRALRCGQETVEVLSRAAAAAGAPRDLVTCVEHSSIEGTTALMEDRNVRVLLATGGIGLVQAANRSGKPCYGVGPGNVPVWVDRSCQDLAKAVDDILASKTFDHGTTCAAEQALVVDAPVEDRFRGELGRAGGRFLTREERDRLAAACVDPGGQMRAEIVGKSPHDLGLTAGISVGPEARVLLVEPDGIGREHPLSGEVLTSVCAYYRAESRDAGLGLVRELLEYGGEGHTVALHASDQPTILRFAISLPSFRVIVNAGASLGAAGMVTALEDSIMIGTGTRSGSITSDNITARHLIHVKRLAYELRSKEEFFAELAGFDANRESCTCEACRGSLSWSNDELAEIVGRVRERIAHG